MYFRELLLIEGIALQGIGNWQAVSEHVGTRTKEEIEQHYYDVYINSPNWPLPVRLPYILHIAFILTLALSAWISNLI